MKLHLNRPRTIKKHGFSNLKEAQKYQSALKGQLRAIGEPEPLAYFITSREVYQFLKLSLEHEIKSVTRWIDHYHTEKAPTPRQLQYKRVLDAEILNRVGFGKWMWPGVNTHTITQRLVRYREHPNRITDSFIEAFDRYLALNNLEVI